MPPMSPQLDMGFAIFTNWQTVLFCLAIYFGMYVFRTFVESFWKGAANNNLWNELGLHCGPIGIGVAIAYFAKSFPWPAPLADVMNAKVMYGMVCGGMSGFLYGRLRAWIGVAADSPSPKVQQLAVKLGGKPSLPPPALEDTKSDAKAPETKPEVPEAKSEAKLEPNVEASKLEEKPVKKSV